MERVERYLQEHRQRFEQELCELLSIPSVSADSSRVKDVRRAAEWLLGQLRDLGLEAELMETAGHPVVYAQSPPVPGAPTLLVYGHYDVQPAEPLDEWLSPPFQPTRREGNLYARGATDDKGQMLTHIKSAEAWLRASGSLPLRLKFLLEGEEETGSENLFRIIDREADRLGCDAVVISDSSQLGPGQPAITYALRGIAYYELRLVGPARDLHSGMFGGAVTNSANALARLLASLVDDQGRVLLPGFYDDVLELTPQERQRFADLGFDEAAFMRRIGVEALSGEAGYSTLERRWARPTFDVNGLWGGYQGEGSKTVLPARAGAKLSFRLVPDQKPESVTRALEAFIEERMPPGLGWELVQHNGAPAVRVPLDSAFLSAAARAVEQAFGRAPVFIREGGSIPIVAAFQQRLGAEPLLLGWGLDDDNAHAPNEKLCLRDFHLGIRASTHLWRQASLIARP
jgi:acetylornithine deacetylase/succinyl-diaminopimelate desuccinylase-like protein